MKHPQHHRCASSCKLCRLCSCSLVQVVEVPIPDLQLSRVAHAATISAEFAHGAAVDMREGMRSRSALAAFHWCQGWHMPMVSGCKLCAWLASLCASDAAGPCLKLSAWYLQDVRRWLHSVMQILGGMLSKRHGWGWGECHLLVTPAASHHDLLSRILPGECRMNVETRLIMVTGEAHTARDYIQAQKVRGRMMGHLAQAFRDCDMLLTPTTAITAPRTRQGCSSSPSLVCDA